MSLNRFVGSTCSETSSGIIIDLFDPKVEDIKIEDIAWALSRQNRFGGHSIATKPYSVAQHTVEVSRIVEKALTVGTEHNEMLSRHVQSILQNMASSPDFETESEDWKMMCLVSDILQEQIKCPQENIVAMVSLHALMHDFAEAYLIDIPTPVKRLPGVYESYRNAEKKMDDVIFEALKLPYHNAWHNIRAFGEFVVKWADLLALKIEAYHMMPSRGLTWNLPQEKPSIIMLKEFVWPIDSNEAYQEVIDRYKELSDKFNKPD